MEINELKRLFIWGIVFTVIASIVLPLPDIHPMSSGDWITYFKLVALSILLLLQVWILSIETIYEVTIDEEHSAIGKAIQVLCVAAILIGSMVVWILPCSDYLTVSVLVIVIALDLTIIEAIFKGDSNG